MHSYRLHWSLIHTPTHSGLDTMSVHMQTYCVSTGVESLVESCIAHLSVDAGKAASIVS